MRKIQKFGSGILLWIERIFSNISTDIKICNNDILSRICCVIFRHCLRLLWIKNWKGFGAIGSLGTKNCLPEKPIGVLATRNWQSFRFYMTTRDQGLSVLRNLQDYQGLGTGSPEKSTGLPGLEIGSPEKSIGLLGTGSPEESIGLPGLGTDSPEKSIGLGLGYQGYLLRC